MAPTVHLLVFISVLIVAFRRSVSAAVIPPAWADSSINPCAKESWQYLYWKGDGECYPIFKRGPCPETQELVFDSAAKEATCRCPSQLLYWEEDRRCYAPFVRGPCPHGSFLHPGRATATSRDQRPDPHRRTLNHVKAWLNQSESNVLEPLGFVHCKQEGYCPPGWAFWFATELCYPLKRQGPCQTGSIFYWDKETGQAECGCRKEMGWRRYYWPISSTCHEHWSRGPCPPGTIFSYNSTSKMTQCSCSSLSPGYHSLTDRCYSKFSQEPCNKGQWLTSRSDELPQHSIVPSIRRVDPIVDSRKITNIGQLTCTCIPGYVYNKEDEQCYREFTQGPCQTGHFFIRNSDGDAGICQLNPCSTQELYFSEQQSCFRIHSSGPCDHGQIVIGYDPHGIGYRGRCGCSPLNTPFYWPDDGNCYPHETQGPCPTTMVISTRFSNELKPTCICPEEHIFHKTTGQCYRLFSQGPCQWNEWLVPESAENDVNSSISVDYSQLESACQCKPGYEYQVGSNYCQPPSMELLISLQNPFNGQERQHFDNL